VGVAGLTKREWRVLVTIVLLLALGWVVKTHRAAPAEALKAGLSATPGVPPVRSVKP
jgi:hypothetical protein